MLAPLRSEKTKLPSRVAWSFSLARRWKLAQLFGWSVVKLAFPVIGLGLLATAPAAFAGPADGAAKFEERCQMCHGAGMGGAPLMDKLAALEAQAVVDKLTNGTMAPMASDLSETDKREIAVFLTKKGLPASGDLPEVKPE